jgi:hypothetical protein
LGSPKTCIAKFSLEVLFGDFSSSCVAKFKEYSNSGEGLTTSSEFHIWAKDPKEPKKNEIKRTAEKRLAAINFFIFFPLILKVMVNKEKSIVRVA